MRIMSSNIWGDYFGNAVELREDGIISVYKKYAPDVLGFQEITESWYNSKLFEALKDDYNIFGARPFDKSIYVPMAVSKRYNMLAYGFEYLENTPDPSKSITWVVLGENSKASCSVCNTHFWWKEGPEHDEIRLENAEQLVSLMKHLREKYSCPVFAFGDMNCNVSHGVFEIYKKNGIRHLNDIAEVKCPISSHHGDPVKLEDGLYHGKRTENSELCSIDHIVALGDGFKARKYEVILDQAALDATDHSPIFADIEFI